MQFVASNTGRFFQALTPDITLIPCCVQSLPDRDGPVHVASIKSTRQDKVYHTHLLRRTYHDGNKVKHQTLGNISHLPPHVIDMIKGALRGETYIAISAAFNVFRSLPHGHVAAVLGTLRRLDLERGLAKRPLTAVWPVGGHDL